MDVILWSLNFAWKILAICMGFMLFKYVLKNGSGTFKEVLDTISAVLRTCGHWLRKHCLNYLKKESAEAEAKTEIPADKEERPEEPKDETVKLTIGGKEIQYADFNEFRDAFINGKPFILK